MATADVVQTTPEEAAPPSGRRVRTRTIVIALVFAFIAAIWTREAELVAFACQITESVPPMTSLAGLLLIAALSIAFRKFAMTAGEDTAAGRFFRWFTLSGQQNMFIYAFITIATIVFSVGVMRTLLPEMTTLTYFADFSNDYGEALPEANPYLHVTDPDAVRQIYEGSDAALTSSPGTGLRGFLYGPIWRTTLVPWRPWLIPMLTWSVFILIMFGTMQCIAALAEREWTLSERLPYPLVEIPLGITEQRSFFAGISFLRDPVMWVGFIIGASYGIHEMIATTTLAFPQLGREYPLGKLLTEHPWSAIGGGINIFLMPEAYGLAYFAPQDVLLTTALSWLGILAFRVATAAAGYDVKATVYRDATAGSFIGLVLASLYVARRPLLEALRRAFGARKRDHDELPGRYVWFMRGALIGMVLMCLFWLWTGLPGHYVAFALFMFMVGAIGHARVRAIAGAATPWLFPHSCMTETYVRLAGAKSIGAEQQWRPFTALFNVRWIDRGYPHSALAAQLESYNMARRSNMDFGSMSKILLWAVPIGLIVGWWMHLTVFYDHGANVLGGGSGVGGVRVQYANTDATWALGLGANPTLMNTSAWWATGIGFLLTAIGLLLRNIFLQIPFHPAGLVIAFSHGQRFWAPFGIVWLIKGLLLRIGGVASYRRLMPGFLGLVIGHYFFTGIVMGLAKMTGLEIFDKIPIIWF